MPAGSTILQCLCDTSIITEKPEVAHSNRLRVVRNPAGWLSHLGVPETLRALLAPFPSPEAEPLLDPHLQPAFPLPRLVPGQRKSHQPD